MRALALSLCLVAASSVSARADPPLVISGYNVVTLGNMKLTNTEVNGGALIGHVVVNNLDTTSELYDVHFGGQLPSSEPEDPHELPEPASLSLLGLGLMGVAIIMRRRRRS